MGAPPTGPARGNRVRIAAAVCAGAGVLILASFFLLPWETYETGFSIHGDRFGSIYDDENGKLVVAASIVTGALAILPLLISLIPGAKRRLWLIALPVAAIAVGWIVFLLPWLNEHVGSVEIGAGVALVAGVVVAGSGIATGVLALRKTPG